MPLYRAALKPEKFYWEIGEMLTRFKKNRNNFIRKNINIKNSVLDYINSSTGRFICE